MVPGQLEEVFRSIPFTAHQGAKGIARWWAERWLGRRIERDDILDEVEHHRLTYPITHGARVQRD